MKTCDGCGKTILKKGVAVGGDNYCDLCYKKYYEKCTGCNTTYAKVCMYPINEGYICGNCLKSSTSQYSMCGICNTLYDVSSGMIVTVTTPNHKKRIICKECMKKLYRKCECDDCEISVYLPDIIREYIYNEFSLKYQGYFFKGPGKFFCSDICASKENLVQCIHDKLYYPENDTIVVGGPHKTGNLKKKYHRLYKEYAKKFIIACPECKGSFYKGDQNINNFVINNNSISMCQECFKKLYIQCRQCGEITERIEGDLRHVNDIICLNCLLRDPVRDYRYRPNPIFLKINRESDCFLGLEIEITMKGKKEWTKNERDKLAGNLIKAFPKCFESKMYIKFDRSVGSEGMGGFEIVTHPMTYNYIRTKSQIKEILAWLEDKVHLNGAGRCGIHIHIDKRQYADKSDGSHIRDNKLFINKLCMFFYCNFDKIKRFSNRESSQIDRWCSPFTKIETIALFRDELRYDRHKAFNMKPQNTIEIRIFNGDVDYPTFIKYIRFTSLLISFLKYYKRSFFDKEFKMSEDQNARYTWATFVEFAKNRSPHLYKEVVDI